MTPPTCSAFGRRTEREAAVTVLNLSDEQREITHRRERLAAGRDGADAGNLNGGTATVEAGEMKVTLGPRGAEVLLTDEGMDLAPPAAPIGLAVAAEAGKVSLGWQPVADATGYTVWRSIVAGGGYQQVGETTATTGSSTPRPAAGRATTTSSLPGTPPATPAPLGRGRGASPAGRG